MVDTIIFDVDGVLWDAATAYNRCTQYVVAQECLAMGLPDPQITLDDIAAFKRAGGFNSDWDMAWTLVVLAIARAKGRISPHKSWRDLAAESGGQGIAWVQHFADESSPDFTDLQHRYDAYYWGAERYPDIYDRPPQLHHLPGFAHVEKPLIEADFIPRLKAAGIQKVGILTGRNRNAPMAQLDFAGLLNPAAVITAEHGSKPAPQLLARVLQTLQSETAVMVGDMIDDLRTVLGYRQLPRSQQPAYAYAVQVAPTDEHEFWRTAGADAVISDINQLPDILPTLSQK
ncbi:MAG: HAD-IA family hydrolase [Chloroflexi bacterium]|nr:HAD-IA family hydrolase [Chloroflexota bacterium]